MEAAKSNNNEVHTIGGKVEAAWLDGTHRITIIAEGNIIWPNGITIDDDSRRLFWCDSFLNTIESIRLPSPEDNRYSQGLSGWASNLQIQRNRI